MHTSIARAPSWRLPAVACAVLALVVGLLAAVASAPAARAAGTAVVSLTFDDGTADQKTAASLLSARGQVGTFYVNSGTIGHAGYLTQSDLQALQSAGHEVGGHTVTHPDLAVLPASEVKREVCQDRSTLKGWGLQVRSFAYPFASMSPTAKQAIKDCGYNSARNLGDIESRHGCDGCANAESIPPADPYETKALDQWEDGWTLDDLKAGVTAAEASTGGWVQYTFHRVCESGCGELAISPTILGQFLDWLKQRGVATRTVGDVVGGADKPPVDGGGSQPNPDASGLTNPGFEQLADNGRPMCWQNNRWGANSATFDVVSPGRTSARAARIRMTAFTSGDAKWTPALDLGTCAPPAVKGAEYQIRGWYKSSAPTQYEVYLRNSAGTWSYWTSSPSFAARSSWTQASFTTPPVPADATGISFGLNIGAVGEIVVDDFSIGATKPVTTATTAPASPDGAGGWFRTAPKATVTLATGSQFSTREYAVGQGQWRTYNAPVTIGEGVTTFSHRARSFGTTGPTSTETYKVDTIAPTAGGSFDAATRTVTVTGQDGGSGVAALEYRLTADGPWTAYRAPFEVDGAARSVAVRATDTAGNVSAVASVDVTKSPVVTTAKVSPADPDGGGGWYASKPTVTLEVVSGAPGAVAEYRLGDGEWTTYSAPVVIGEGTTSLQYRGRDGDETEDARTLALKVDTTVPTVSGTLDPATRKVTAKAEDAGSGVAGIEHRVDGGAWTPYTGPVAVGEDEAQVELRATDVAGNVSAPTTVKVPLRPGVAKVALSVQDDTVRFGDRVSGRVTVASSRGASTGWVDLLVDGRRVASLALAKGSASYLLRATDRLGVGTHRLVARYRGDAVTQAGSSAARTLRVAKARTALTMVSGSRARAGAVATVRLRLSVPGTTLRPGGRIAVKVSGMAVKTVTVRTKDRGSVLVRLRMPRRSGAVTVKALYLGSSSYGAAMAAKRVVLR